MTDPSAGSPVTAPTTAPTGTAPTGTAPTGTAPTGTTPSTAPSTTPGTVVLVVEFTAVPDTVDELRERLLELTRLTRAEQGCLRYDLHADATDPLRLVFVEEWSSAEAHAAHDRTPWVDDFRAHRDRLLAQDGLRRLDLTRLEP